MDENNKLIRFARKTGEEIVSWVTHQDWRINTRTR
jgi:hypothetical protein